MLLSICLTASLLTLTHSAGAHPPEANVGASRAPSSAGTGWLVHLSLGGGGLGVPVYVDVPRSLTSEARSMGQLSTAIGPAVSLALWPLFARNWGVAVEFEAAWGLLPRGAGLIDWADRELGGFKFFFGDDAGWAVLGRARVSRARASVASPSQNGGGDVQSGSGRLVHGQLEAGIHRCTDSEGARCNDFFEWSLFAARDFDVTTAHPFGIRASWTRRTQFTWGAEVSWGNRFAGTAHFNTTDSTAVAGVFFVGASIDVWSR